MMKINRMVLTGMALLTAAAFPLSSFGEEGDLRFRSLLVETFDGQHYGINLADYMSSRFNEEADFEVTAPQRDETGNPVTDPETGMQVYKTYLAIPGYELSKVTFGTEESGVNAPAADREFDLGYDYNTGILRITGAEGKSIGVFSTDGRREYGTRGAAETVIDMSRLGSGIHLVKIDSKTVKLFVK